MININSDWMILQFDITTHHLWAWTCQKALKRFKSSMILQMNTWIVYWKLLLHMSRRQEGKQMLKSSRGEGWWQKYSLLLLVRTGAFPRYHLDFLWAHIRVVFRWMQHFFRCASHVLFMWYSANIYMAREQCMNCIFWKWCFVGAKHVTRFIEEDHSYKLASWEKQRQRPAPPGRPSQDMMSYWGISIHLSCVSYSPCRYWRGIGYKFETLCLLPDIWDRVSRDFIENRENEIVNNHAQVG